MSKKIIDEIIMPGLLELEPYGIPVTDRAIAMMYAIGMQESRFANRFQIPLESEVNRKGPARGFWQFEATGGVHCVLQYRCTNASAEAFCHKYVGSLGIHAVWATLEYEDVLASAFARLLLLTDPRALPDATLQNEQAAWDHYIRNWRPGEPYRNTWNDFWQDAVKLVTEKE